MRMYEPIVQCPYTLIQTHTHTDIYKHTHKYANTHRHTDIYKHPHTNTHTHIYNHSYTDTHTHIQTHKHIYRHTHLPSPTNKTINPLSCTFLVIRFVYLAVSHTHERTGTVPTTHRTAHHLP